MLLFAAAVAAFAVVLATVDAYPANAASRSQKLVDLWAIEVTPKFARSVRPRLLRSARRSGINTVVLNRHLSPRQKRRVRSLARRVDLIAFQPRRVCKRKTRGTCAVLVRRPAAVRRVARLPYVDVIVLRLRRPERVPRLARKSELATARRTAGRLMLLPAVRARPRFVRPSWRKAISATADTQRVDLGVSPRGGSRVRAFKLFLPLLADNSSPGGPPPPPDEPFPFPPPPAPNTGKIVFNGNFETGDHSQWTWGAQCANTGEPSSGSIVRGTLSVQSEVAAQGEFGARFELPASGEKTACETLAKRQVGVGTDDYYGLMVRFPADWREPSSAGWGLSLAQLNFQNIWGAPVSLHAHADHVALVMQSGRCNSVETSKPGCTYSSGRNGNVAPMVAVPAPLALEEWHQLIVRVRWATDSSGVIEVWHRLQGEESWNKTVSLDGYPTVQWTEKERPVKIDGNSSDKIGAYRGGADLPLTVWHDGFVRTTTFAAAAAALS
jgi:hypothetical protein